jgi:hypothetical protein
MLDDFMFENLPKELFEDDSFTWNRAESIQVGHSFGIK